MCCRLVEYKSIAPERVVGIERIAEILVPSRVQCSLNMIDACIIDDDEAKRGIARNMGQCESERSTPTHQAGQLFT